VPQTTKEELAEHILTSPEDEEIVVLFGSPRGHRMIGTCDVQFQFHLILEPVYRMLTQALHDEKPN